MATAMLPEAPAAGPKKPSGLNVRVVGSAVRRRPLAFVTLLLATAGTAAGVYTFLPVSKVTAAVQFQIASQTPTIVGTGAGGGDFLSYKITQASLIKNPTTLSTAAGDPKVRGLAAVRTAEPDPVAWLDRTLKVDIKSGELMRVTLDGDNGDELMAVLDALAANYLKTVRDQASGGQGTKLETLEKALKEYTKEIEDHRTRLNTMQMTLPGHGDKLNYEQWVIMYGQQVKEAVGELARLTNDKAVHQAELDALRRSLEAPRKAAPKADPKADAKGEPKGEPDPKPDADPRAAYVLAKVEQLLAQDRGLADKVQKLAQAQKQLEDDKGSYQPISPKISESAQRVAAAQAGLDEYKARRRTELMPQAEAEYEGWAKRAIAVAERKVEEDKLLIDLANRRIEELRAAGRADALQRADREKLEAQIAGKEAMAQATRKDIEGLRLNMQAPPRVSQLGPAVVLPAIEGNRRMKFAALAAFGLFVLGFGGLVGWEAKTRRVTHTDEATTDLGLRLLGTVPPIGGPGSAGAPPAALAEAIDTARTMLLHGTPAGGTMRTVLVTSGVAGEGKTSLAGHLAISLARAGYRTCLVDGDLQSPAAHRLFDVPVGPGLCELLRGQNPLEEVARPTPVPGLSILPAGRWDTTARQCLVGTRWRELKAELEERFQFVVVDSAPLLFISDTLLLAREADGVVLSVLIGVSQVGNVAETAGRLQAVGANLTGAVVNGVWHKAHRAGYPYRSADPVTAPAVAEPGREGW